ncbi:MAG: hypothetical protein U9Q62_11500 [Campylobacterota bacterium]|nr:hypothetical protein [Campylobacterota bacterium]
MSETTFIVKSLENGWMWQDMRSDDDLLVYCSEELEVPDELIDELECYEHAFKVALHRDRSYFNDDWYVNLQRVAC